MSKRVLIVKASSMGDILHALPALTDAVRAHPTYQFDWLVDESFADIVKLHPAIKEHYGIAIRRWRRQNPISTFREIIQWRRALPENPYDLIIDCQGNWKSALLAKTIRGPIVGYDRESAREPSATRLYNRHIYAYRLQHAIDQHRTLFAAALDYPVDTEAPIDYGIRANVAARSSALQLPPNAVLCLHGTTWANKHFPEHRWQHVTDGLIKRGLIPVFAWGNDIERKRAERLAAPHSSAIVLDRLPLTELAHIMTQCTATIGLDTGLTHLAAALDVPGVALFGPTDPALSGPIGNHQNTISVDYPCAPCGKRRCQLVSGDDAPPCWQSINIDTLLDALSSTTGAPADATQ